MSLPDGIGGNQRRGVGEPPDGGVFCHLATPSTDQFLRGLPRSAMSVRLPDPASRYTGLAGFFLDVGDRFRIRLDLLLHTIEFSERFLPVVSDLGALCRIGAGGEVG